MKQVYKFYICFLFVLIASFLITSNVFAFEDGSYIGHEYATNMGNYHEDAIKTDKNSYMDYYMGTHYTNYNGKEYYIYCIDSARQGGGNNADLYVYRVLDQSDPKDAVILYIMSRDKYDYDSKVMAVRAFSPFIKTDFRNNANLDNYHLKISVANANVGIKWANEDENKSILKVLNIKDNSIATLSANAGFFANQSYNSNKVLSEANSYVRDAKTLFLEGLKYGAEVADGKHINNKKVEYFQPTFVDGKHTVVSAGSSVKSTRDIMFSVKFTGFNKGHSIKLDVTPSSNVAISTDKLQYQDPETQAWKNFSNFELPSLLNGDKVEKLINFRLTVTAVIPSEWITSGKNVDVTLKLDADYKDEESLTGAFLYNKNSSDTQHFYTYDSDKQKHYPETFKLSWNVTPDFCATDIPDKNNIESFKSYLKICCRGDNLTNFSVEDECNKAVKAVKTDEDKARVRSNNLWCQKQQLYCDVCDGTISVPQKCSELGDGTIPKCEDNADAVIKDNDNIKLCVLDYSDQAKNKYKMTTDANVASNDYCNVYCKEDYKVSLPLGRWVSSGRTFTVGINVNASKTCYTDLINYDKFVTDLSLQKAKLDANIYDTKARREYTRILNQYKTCAEASWKSDIKFDQSQPSISLTYDESEYINNKELFKDNKVEFVIGKNSKGSTLTTSNGNIWLCGGNNSVDVDNYYNECINGTVTNKASSQVSTYLNGYYNPETFTKTRLTIPLTKYAKKTSFASAVYVPKDNLYTKVGSGVITAKTISLNEYEKLSASINVNGEQVDSAGKLPIALRRKYGSYRFNVYFNGIGEFFDSGKTGRLVGGKNSVALKDNNSTFEGEYACSYIVNCSECNIDCVNDPKNGIFCDLDDPCPNGDCDKICIKCENEPICPDCQGNIGMYIARQISLNNLNPSNRKLGINLSNMKGRAAVNNITSKGETIYEGNSGEAQYTITLTPNETRMLQRYNNIKVDSGGYASFDDFECYLYSTTIKDKNSDLYKKAKENDYTICKSKLLNQKLNSYTLNNVKISDTGTVSWIEACEKENKSVCVIGGFYGPAFK